MEVEIKDTTLDTEDMEMEIGSIEMEVASKSLEAREKDQFNELQLEEPLDSDIDMDETGTPPVEKTDTSSQEASLSPNHSGSTGDISSKPKSRSSCFSEETGLESDPEAESREEGGGDCCKHWRKLSRHDRIELSQSFQRAVSYHDWASAERLVHAIADVQALNDVLCVAVDAIWFLNGKDELREVVGLIKRIVAGGASDFNRAAARTSFLASCVSACRGWTTSLSDAMSFTGQRFQERLQECHDDDVLKEEASAQKFTEWALKCIELHSRMGDERSKGNHGTIIEIQLQLAAFKSFLDLADNDLTGKDFTEAFDAACFPLTLFSSSFENGWATGISAIAIQGLLEMLVEGGADNVNQCFLEAARNGSTELVRVLLQIAHRNSLDIDVDLALDYAACYTKLGTMEWLVQEGNAVAFRGPLMRAAERGCMEVVQWFVTRGCRDTELCLALMAATSSSQVRIAAYLLPLVPQHVLAAQSIEILKGAGERSTGWLDGVAFLLRSDFLGDPATTYAVADSIATSTDDTVDPKLRTFLREHWSEAAFSEGVALSEDHFVNFMRVLERGTSPICLRDLPLQLVIAMAYLPLYRECIEAGGLLLPQSLRGQLAGAVCRLEGRRVDRTSHGKELLAALEHHLLSFMVLQT